MPPIPTPYPLPTDVPIEEVEEFVAYFWDFNNFAPAISTAQTTWMWLYQYRFLVYVFILAIIYLVIRWMWNLVESRGEDV